MLNEAKVVFLQDDGSAHESGKLGLLFFKPFKGLILTLESVDVGGHSVAIVNNNKIDSHKIPMVRRLIVGLDYNPISNSNNKRYGYKAE